MNAEGVNECSQPLVSNPPPYTCQGYLGIIQTTWDQVATLFGAVFTPMCDPVWFEDSPTCWRTLTAQGSAPSD